MEVGGTEESVGVGVCCTGVVRSTELSSMLDNMLGNIEVVDNTSLRRGVVSSGVGDTSVEGDGVCVSTMPITEDVGGTNSLVNVGITLLIEGMDDSAVNVGITLLIEGMDDSAVNVGITLLIEGMDDSAVNVGVILLIEGMDDSAVNVGITLLIEGMDDSAVNVGITLLIEGMDDSAVNVGITLLIEGMDDSAVNVGITLLIEGMDDSAVNVSITLLIEGMDDSAVNVGMTLLIEGMDDSAVNVGITLLIEGMDDSAVNVGITLLIEGMDDSAVNVGITLLIEGMDDSAVNVGMTLLIEGMDDSGVNVGITLLIEGMDDSAVNVGMTLLIEGMEDSAVNVGITLLIEGAKTKDDSAVNVGMTLLIEGMEDSAVNVGITLLIEGAKTKDDSAVNVGATLLTEGAKTKDDSAVNVGATLLTDGAKTKDDSAVNVGATLLTDGAKTKDDSAVNVGATLLTDGAKTKDDSAVNVGATLLTDGARTEDDSVVNVGATLLTEGARIEDDSVENVKVGLISGVSVGDGVILGAGVKEISGETIGVVIGKNIMKLEDCSKLCVGVTCRVVVGEGDNSDDRETVGSCVNAPMKLDEATNIDVSLTSTINDVDGDIAGVILKGVPSVKLTVDGVLVKTELWNIEVSGPRSDALLGCTKKTLLPVGCGVSATEVVAKRETVLLGNTSVDNGVEIAGVENGMLGVPVRINEVSVAKEVVGATNIGVVNNNVSTELVAKDRLAVSNMLDGCTVNDVGSAVEVVRSISSENDGVGVGAAEVGKAVVVCSKSSDVGTEVEAILETEGKNNSEESVVGGTKSSVDSEARLLENVGVGVSIGPNVVPRRGVGTMVEISSED